MNGLYYYKLVSPYSEDVTKNCKLTVNEIDSNFFNLKSNDIDSAEFIREQKVLVLTRKNGDKLFVDLSNVTYDFDATIKESESGTTLSFTYDSAEGEKSVTLENIMTVDNVKEIIKKETKVVTDSTIIGNGSASHPLGIKRTEMTGMFAPAIGLVDITNGEELPSEAKLGTRYLTKEYVSDYGYLYNAYATAKIDVELKNDGRGWRVPTKSDWDALLNSVEPCEYRNHNSAKCHVELGKYAGRNLKSECGWLGQPECSCDITVPQTACTSPNNADNYVGSECFDSVCGCVGRSGGCECHSETSGTSDLIPNDKVICARGTDRYGFTALPSGIGRLNSFLEPETSLFKEVGVFWTSTHLNNDIEQDIYVKEFDWNRGGVEQSAECPRAYYSVRLVKDYDGHNNFGAEYINGILYETILMPQSNQVWLASNFVNVEGLNSSSENCSMPDYIEVNNGEVNEKRKEIFENVWNGCGWEKRILHEGDTVVLENSRYNDTSERNIDVTWVDNSGDTHTVSVLIPRTLQHNVEYRVYTNDVDCDKDIVNTDDLVIERVLNTIVPIIEAEREERIEGYRDLEKKINDEMTARVLADERITESINAERLERVIGDSQLWDAVNQEASARTDVDNQLWEAISQEASARTDVDNQLWDGINGETTRAQEVEGQLWSGINGETTRAQEVEGQLWEAVNQEASARTDVDNQLWEAVNDEIERAKNREDEIDGQLISADVEYVIKVAEGFDLVQKNGGLIHIEFDGNYGQI